MNSEHDERDGAGRIPEQVVQVPLEKLDAEPGVAEAIELYESAMRHYLTAVTSSYPQVARVTSANLAPAVN